MFSALLVLILATRARAVDYQGTAVQVTQSTFLVIAGSVDGVAGTGETAGLGPVLTTNVQGVQGNLGVQPSPVQFSSSGQALTVGGFTVAGASGATLTEEIPIPGLGGGSMPVRFEVTDYSATLPSTAGTLDLAKQFRASITYLETFDYRVVVGGEPVASGTVNRVSTVPTPYYPAGVDNYYLSADDSAFPRLRFQIVADSWYWLLDSFTGSVNGHALALTFYVRIPNVVSFDTGAPPTTSTTTTTSSSSTTTSIAACEDSDRDGVPDVVDKCSATPLGRSVDSDGCSPEQFCAGFDATTRDGARACKKADWRNDEPLMRARDADCMIDRHSQPPRCVPTP